MILDEQSLKHKREFVVVQVVVVAMKDTDQQQLHNVLMTTAGLIENQPSTIVDVRTAVKKAAAKALLMLMVQLISQP